MLPALLFAFFAIHALHVALLHDCLFPYFYSQFFFLGVYELYTQVMCIGI